MSKSNENNPFLAPVLLGSVTADGLVPALYCRKKHIIKTVALINGAVLAAHAVDKVKVQLKNGATVLAEWFTDPAAEGALAAEVAAELPEKEIEVAAGSTLSVNVDVSGTGVLTEAVLQLEMYKV